jgi:hypothetical protein
LLIPPVGIIRACGPHPFGAAVAARRRSFAPAALKSNPRYGITVYTLSFQACSLLRASMPSTLRAGVALRRRCGSLRAIRSTTRTPLPGNQARKGKPEPLDIQTSGSAVPWRRVGPTAISPASRPLPAAAQVCPAR